MRALYPEIQPNEHGMLDVGDGQRLYWEECGNPEGKPAVFLHGGPAPACTAGPPAAVRSGAVPHHPVRPARLRPEPAARQCPGRRPERNTTWHLVADIERLREHLGVDRWQVFGGSWGSTLALAYAERIPTASPNSCCAASSRCGRASSTGSTRAAPAPCSPTPGSGFLAPVPEAERGALIAAYTRLLADPDPAVHGPAAVAWASWEASGITLLPHPEVVDRFAEPDLRARLRPHREPLLHEPRLARGGPAAARTPRS